MRFKGIEIVKWYQSSRYWSALALQFFLFFVSGGCGCCWSLVIGGREVGDRVYVGWSLVSMVYGFVRNGSGEILLTLASVHNSNC